jgi:UMF1 family MFS transporter
LKSLLLQKPVLSWALYDWANSAFATTVMAGFFPLFFSQYWSAGNSAAVTTFRLGITSGIASFILAVLAPLLGAMADHGGKRRKFLFVFTAMGVLGSGALYYVAKGEWQYAAAFFALGSLGFSAA